MAKILFVLTGASYWTLKNGHRRPTGYWAEEFVAPYETFAKAGHEVTVATPGAVVPTVDTMSLRPDMAGSEQKARMEEDVIERADQLRWPIPLRDARTEDYDAVYYPGGHGPMEDLAFDHDSGKILVDELASGKPLAVVCHAPAALLATRDMDGNSPFTGRRITGFTDEEEAALGLASKAKWLMEDEVRKLGVEFSRGPMWEPYTVTDHNLYTGQNPASAGPVAQEVLKVLN
ncbi:MAG: type 1 glutamine amidotransferase protein [Actinomycetia bacterium]|nr:type 1 glutamine amidotransferase protein [Actinomycetes bacterium]